MIYDLEGENVRHVDRRLGHMKFYNEEEKYVCGVYDIWIWIVLLNLSPYNWVGQKHQFVISPGGIASMRQIKEDDKKKTFSTVEFIFSYVCWDERNVNCEYLNTYNFMLNEWGLLIMSISRLKKK